MSMSTTVMTLCGSCTGIFLLDSSDKYLMGISHSLFCENLVRTYYTKHVDTIQANVPFLYPHNNITKSDFF